MSNDKNNYLKCKPITEDGIKPLEYKDLPNLIHPRQSQGLGTDIRENTKIPAGFTYLGQFVAHDISYNRLSSPGSIPQLRLNNLYGAGPVLMPYLYLHYPRDIKMTDSMPPPPRIPKVRSKYFYRGIKLRLRKMEDTGYTYYDVDRNSQGMPLMADCRNDQHLILSQLHVAFIRFHNAVVDYLAHEGHPAYPDTKDLKETKLFNLSRKVVIQHYQWMIIHFYLEAIVYNRELIQRLIDDNQNFIFFNADLPPVLTLEFSDAVLRMGHSQIAEEYTVDAQNTNRRLFLPSQTKGKDLKGFIDRFKILSQQTQFDWRLFFYLDAQKAPQASSAIDHAFVTTLGDIPFYAPGKRNLVKTDMMKAYQHSAIGHHYADCLKNADSSYTPLSIDEIKTVEGFGDMSDADIKRIPLWLYILLEAQIRCEGLKLGPLGSQIMAEQILWVLKYDNDSYIKDTSFSLIDFFKLWRPEGFSIKKPHYTDHAIFGMHDIIKFPDHVEGLINQLNFRGPATPPTFFTSNNTIMPLSEFASHIVHEQEYNTARDIFINNRASTLLKAEYSHPDVSVLSTFSVQAIWNMLGLPGDYDQNDIRSQVVGISFLFGWKDNALVLLARSSNSKNTYLKNSEYLISTGAADTTGNGDAVFIGWLNALKIKTIRSAIDGTISSFAFSRSGLYNLAFNTPNPNLTGNILLDLVIGTCDPIERLKTGVWLNLANVTDNVHRMGEGCPDKCYYQLVFETPSQPNG